MCSCREQGWLMLSSRLFLTSNTLTTVTFLSTIGLDPALWHPLHLSRPSLRAGTDWLREALAILPCSCHIMRSVHRICPTPSAQAHKILKCHVPCVCVIFRWLPVPALPRWRAM